MKPLIRAYNKNDKDSCVEAFRSNVPLYFTEEEIEDFERFLIKIEHHDQSESTHYFVVMQDQKLIGCGGFGKEDNNQTISLAWGLIHKDYQKKGVGKELLFYRLEQIKKLFSHFDVVLDTTQFSYKFFGIRFSNYKNNKRLLRQWHA